MWPLGDAALAAMYADQRGTRVRLISLTPDYDIRWVWRDDDSILTDVSVTSERTRTPRTTAGLTVADPGGLFAPQQPGDAFYTSELLRVEVGSIISAGLDWIPLGTFVITSASPDMQGNLQVSCEDPMWLLQQQLGETVTIAAGVTAEAALVQLWQDYLPPGTSWNLDGGGRTLGQDRTWIESDNRLDAGLSLMTDLGLEAYADRLGAVVLIPARKSTQAPIVATLDTLPGTATIMDLTRTVDRLAYNRVVVISETPDEEQPVYRATAEVTDPASPLHPDRIGLRVAPVYRSAQIPDQAAANAVAAAQLVEQSLIQDGIAGTFVPLWHLDEGDVVYATEPISGTEAAYVLERVTFGPFSGSMAAQATRIVSVFA